MARRNEIYLNQTFKQINFYIFSDKDKMAIYIATLCNLTEPVSEDKELL